MKKYAVITAGGSGLRMGSHLPKQFMGINGKQVLWYTFKTFLTAYPDINFIFVLPENYLNEGESLVKSLDIANQTILVQGGNTRFHSVQNGLAKITTSSIVFVHDGVRCLVSPALIKNCYEQAMELGSAIPAVASADSVRIEEHGQNKPINRNMVRIVQTPQTFKSELILPAFQQTYQEIFTDEATVVETFGHPVFLIEGEYQNIKITRPIDLLLAESILKERQLL
ncbi:MAG: 2-C-methyl-D-erythritol 4-phosphate cytidylyltransferase [Sediminibacterium sp.]|nr:2-C-methyl-D-erythritol 4-phosphate cytidylyltransferase [Sediminibacterium sp.]